MFIREDFPAPEGPMIAISSPLLNLPEMPFKRTFCPGGNNSNRLSHQEPVIEGKNVNDWTGTEVRVPFLRHQGPSGTV